MAQQTKMPEGQMQQTETKKQPDTHERERFLLSCCGTQTVQTVAALLLAKQRAFNAISMWILNNIRRGKKNAWTVLLITGKSLSFSPGQTFHLVSTKTALP